MLVPVDLLQPIEIILQTLFYQYLMNTYCLTVVSEQNIDVHMFPKPLMYINANDQDNLAMNMLNATEMGCSDYLVEMVNPEVFFDIYEENIHVGNARRSDRKLLLIVTSEKQEDLVLKILKMKGARFTANILLILPTKVTKIDNITCEHYKFVSHKYLGEDNNDDPVLLDEWNSCSRLFKNNHNLFPYDMSDMRGKTLKLACFTYKPYALLDLDKKIVPNGYDGTEIRIVEEFCRWINCKIELVRDDDGQWGEIFENRTGSGVLGNVVEDRADIGVTALYTWYHEYRFLDLSMPGIRTGVTCVAPAPRLLPSWELPVMPFSWATWAAVALTFVLAALVLMVARGSTDRALLTTFGILVTQSQPESAIRPGTRCVVIWLLVTGLVLDNAYGGGLASVFTVPKYERPIDTVQDLVDADIQCRIPCFNKRYKRPYASEKWRRDHIQKTPNLVRLVNKFTIYKEEDLRRKTFSRDYAFSVERLPAGHYAIGEYVSEKAVPHLKLMKEDIYWEQCLMMARKSSPYTKKYNQLLSRLHSSGILLAWETQERLFLQITLRVP